MKDEQYDRAKTNLYRWLKKKFIEIAQKIWNFAKKFGTLQRKTVL
jgi:hypothetical protein